MKSNKKKKEKKIKKESLKKTLSCETNFKGNLVVGYCCCSFITPKKLSLLYKVN